MRRDPAAIVAAHEMDKRRRDIYVEGVRDRVFLQWLVGRSLDPDCQVLTIDLVDVPDVSEGGNRARLLRFLREMEGTTARIRGLVDSDQDRLFHVESFPSNTWVTDHRDLESYVISEANIDAVLRAGCGLATPAAASVYQAAAAHARFMAAVRLHSLRRDLGLPVSALKWVRLLTCHKDGSITLNRERVLGSLLQSADKSLRMMDVVMEGIVAVEDEVSAVPDRDLIQGKDFMAILTKQLAVFGVQVDTAGRLAFATFDRTSLSAFESLASVVAYVSLSRLFGHPVGARLAGEQGAGPMSRGPRGSGATKLPDRIEDPDGVQRYGAPRRTHD